LAAGFCPKKLAFAGKIMALPESGRLQPPSLPGLYAHVNCVFPICYQRIYRCIYLLTFTVLFFYDYLLIINWFTYCESTVAFTCRSLIFHALTRHYRLRSSILLHISNIEQWLLFAKFSII